LVEGTQIGDYKIEKPIGAGGFGMVYLARDVNMRRQAVIKLLHTGSADSDAVQRFCQEASAAGGLKHPSIVVVYTHGFLPGGQPYIAYEYLDGGTLAALMDSTRDAKRNRAPLELRTAAQIVLKIASALHRAHLGGIVHRDIKPHNILLTRQDDDPHHPTVIDFGLAKLTEDASPVRTREGIAVGTPGYMAPEQLAGVIVDARADQYSLATILWELTVGRSMWADDHGLKVMLENRHRGTTPPNPCDTRPELPIAFGAVVAKALARTPADRFPSMREFGIALSRSVPSDFGGDSSDLLYRYAANLTVAHHDAATVGHAVPEVLTRAAMPTLRVLVPPVGASELDSVNFAKITPPPIQVGRPGAVPTVVGIPVAASGGYASEAPAHIRTMNAIPVLSAPPSMPTQTVEPTPPLPPPMAASLAAHTPAPAPVAFSRRRGRLLVALGGAVVATGVVVAVVLGATSYKPTPTPTPVRAPAPVPATSPAATSALAIITEPTGAAVALDGAGRGAAPLNLAAPVGSTVEVRAELPGYAPALERVHVGADPATVRLVLVSLASGVDAGVDSPAPTTDARSADPRGKRRRPPAGQTTPAPEFDPDGVIGP